jgi:N-acetyl-alpha-D-muramate 1-phosphate uridylyltransferase
VTGTSRLTYAGIGVYHQALFSTLSSGTLAPLAPLLRAAIAQNAAYDVHYKGCWIDVGTPERLADLDAQLQAQRSTPTQRHE